MIPTLLPPPREFRRIGGYYRLPSRGRIEILGRPSLELLPDAARLQSALREFAGLEWEIAADASGEKGLISLELGRGRTAGKEAYELRIGRSGITARAAQTVGIRHAVSTLIQLLTQAGRRLPCLSIFDAPAMPNRGVMLDISRDKVPTFETLCALIDMLASWKINQVQLYTEHTFAYRNHQDAWKDSSPVSGEEIVRLDAFCRERGVELVPNQNSFGHMHRWLTKKRYRDLAEAPHGCQTAWGWFKEPFSLNPTDPRSIKLLRGLYDELLPHFCSGQFNVGCDETVDLGKGRSAAAVKRMGVGRVYLDFLLRIYREVKARKRTMQFWGDIIQNHPELVPRLPRDVIALVWGYEWDYPFRRECARFARAGIPFYVCPGTSSWLTILGRTENATRNIQAAAEQGAKQGAIGLLNTDWGDRGHWQYLPVSYLGFAAGAAAAWNPGGARRMNLPRALDLFAFRDKANVMGAAAWKLGNAYKALGTRYFNATGFGLALMTGLADIRKNRKQKKAGLVRTLAAIRKAAAPLRRAKMQGPDAALIKREYANAVRMAEHGTRRALLAFESDPRRAKRMKRELARDLLGIMAEHKKVWHARNRPGGFKDSFAGFLRARRDYLK